MSTSANPIDGLRRTLRGAAWLTLALSLLSAACKPADEAPRRPEAPRPEAAAPSPDGGEPGGTRGTIRLTAPDPSDPADAAVAALPDVEAAEGDSARPGTAEALLGLPAEVVARVRAAPSDEARSRADALARKARQLHRKLEVPSAVETWRAALEAWPGHLGANYGLASARALQGEAERALHHLRVIGVIGGRDAQERLRAARTDPDFERLVDDASFRALTDYVPVRVVPSRSLDDEETLERVTEALRDAGVPARADADAWPEELGRSTLLVRGDDEAASAMADEVEAALSGEMARRSVPGAEPPLVLVVAPGARPAGGSDAPTDLVGRALVARPDGAVERLRLKHTGFFTWERLEDDGRRFTRTGRYHLDNGALSLSYRQVVERPRRGGAPDVEIEQGRRSSFKVRVEGGALWVDDLAFRPDQ